MRNFTRSESGIRCLSSGESGGNEVPISPPTKYNFHLILAHEASNPLPALCARRAAGEKRGLAMDARREAKNETYLEQMLVFFGGAGGEKKKRSHVK